MEYTFKGFKNVLVIHTRVDVRSTIRDTLKDLGIAKITAASTVQEGWAVLESMPGSPPDWIITDIELDQKFSGFSLLALTINEPKFVKTRISFITSDTEHDLLPPAFEMGLLSYHQLPFTKTTLYNTLANLIKHLPTNYSMHCLSAAEYLRENLNCLEEFASLISLEEALLLRFPDIPSGFLKLAEAQILNGQSDLARRTLWQAQHLGADLKIGVKQLKELIDSNTEDDSLAPDDKNCAKTFGLKSALIVDPDSLVASQLEQILKDIGIEDIVIFSDGEAAANWVASHDLPGLIIQEWKLPKLSGAAFVQRVVQSGVNATTLIVLSSLIQKEDDSLLKEMGVTAVVGKPLRPTEFLRAVMAAIREDRFPTSFTTIERKLRQALSAGNLGLAQKLYSKIAMIKNVPQVKLWTLDAEIACASGNYEEARDLAQKALSKKGDVNILLNLLGKVYLRLGDNESAFKCLDRAQQLSTKNLERLCLLAEACSEKGDSDKAQEILAMAQSLDRKNEQVINASVNVAINSGDVQKARQVMLTMDSLGRVVSYMNNRAVTLARQGRVEESIELYKNALASVPDSCTTDRSTLNYNIGLALVRVERLKEAELHLSAVNLPPEHIISKKTTSLLTRVRQVLSTSGKIKLQVSDTIQKSTNLSKARPIALHTAPGQLCLHLIFRSDEKYFAKIMPVLENTPRLSWSDKSHQSA